VIQKKCSGLDEVAGNKCRVTLAIVRQNDSDLSSMSLPRREREAGAGQGVYRRPAFGSDDRRRSFSS
jgi:hypothetical protein